MSFTESFAPRSPPGQLFSLHCKVFPNSCQLNFETAPLLCLFKTETGKFNVGIYRVKTVTVRKVFVCLIRSQELCGRVGWGSEAFFS